MTALFVTTELCMSNKRHREKGKHAAHATCDIEYFCNSTLCLAFIVYSTKLQADTHLDSSTDQFVNAWQAASSNTVVDYVITSPPYQSAVQYARNALKLARKAVCLKLRLSFLEPCLDRDAFLREFPIDLVIPMRRTTDAPLYKKGFSDSVCDAWLIWWMPGMTDNAQRRRGVLV